MPIEIDRAMFKQHIVQLIIVLVCFAVEFAFITWFQMQFRASIQG